MGNVGITEGIDGSFRPASGARINACILALLGDAIDGAVCSLGSGACGMEAPLARSGIPVLGLEMDPLRSLLAVQAVLRAEDQGALPPASLVLDCGDLCLLRPCDFLSVIPSARWVIYADSEGMPEANVAAITRLVVACGAKVAGLICSHKDLHCTMDGLQFQERLSGLLRAGSGQSTSMFVYKATGAGPPVTRIAEVRVYICLLFVCFI